MLNWFSTHSLEANNKGKFYKGLKNKSKLKHLVCKSCLFSLPGHEDALDDFGIYEFVAFPDASSVPRVGFPRG